MYKDLDRRTLTFQTALRPYRRAIQLLAQVARAGAISKGWIGEQDLPEVIDDDNNSPDVLEGGDYKDTLESEGAVRVLYKGGCWAFEVVDRVDAKAGKAGDWDGVKVLAGNRQRDQHLRRIDSYFSWRFEPG
ncbi:hypothetical protein HDV00_001980 [Rhizophlyctis rosea]|nr:hypothetical protein HDV00_001980 [Rhizophlyctis rosea]